MCTPMVPPLGTLTALLLQPRPLLLPSVRRSRASHFPSCAPALPSAGTAAIAVQADRQVALACLPLYVFSGGDAERAEALERFQRIDDVVMGGVSRSKLIDGEGCASWRGFVRTEGGGFCGQRTCPFKHPLNVSGADGVYLKCRLASDAEPERRVWKLSLRTQEGRGEVVYQAPFMPPAGKTMQSVFVPFSDFVLVRGPVAVTGAPRLSEVGALYQLGFTVSKFVIGETMTALDNFRNGSFQLEIGELGVYKGGAAATWPNEQRMIAPPVMPEAKAQRARPLAERLITRFFSALFSEQKRRRVRAAELLARRGASRLDIAWAGWRFKRCMRGQTLLGSALGTAGEGISAVCGGALLALFKVLVLPLVAKRMRGQRRREVEGARASRPSSE